MAWPKRVTKEQIQKADEARLRNTFAAAALTGLIANGDYSVEFTPMLAYRMADAMLRERPQTYEQTDATRTVSNMNHDAAPEATADLPDERPPNAVSANGGTPGAASRDGSGTGNTLSRVEIDALQHVVEDGRIVDMSDYGYLRSLLVRLRPEWEDEQDESDRSQPINEAAKTNATQPRNGTPAECSAQVGCSHSYEKTDAERGNSNTAGEPVAWWLKGCEYDTGCEYEYVSLVKESADAAAAEGGTVTPLYVHPAEPCPYVTGKTTRYCTLTPFTLSEEERVALRAVVRYIERASTTESLRLLRQAYSPLRGLLERAEGDK